MVKERLAIFAERNGTTSAFLGRQERSGYIGQADSDGKGGNGWGGDRLEASAGDNRTLSVYFLRDEEEMYVQGGWGMVQRLWSISAQLFR